MQLAPTILHVAKGASSNARGERRLLLKPACTSNMFEQSARVRFSEGNQLVDKARLNGFN